MGTKLATFVLALLALALRAAAEIERSDVVVQSSNLAMQQEFELQAGIIAFEQRQFRRALDHFYKLPEDPIAIRYRSLCFLELDERSAALAELETFGASATAGLETPAANSTKNEVSQASLNRPFVNASDVDFKNRVIEMAARNPDQEPYVYGLPEEDSFSDPGMPWSGSDSVSGGFGENTAGPNGPPPNRKWNVTFITGHQYDSNAALSPSFTGLGSNVRKQDCSWFIATLGDYRLIQEPDRVIGLLSSTYDNFFFSQSQFDLQDYMGGAYANYALGDNWIAGIRYEFHDTLLDYDSFANEHRLVPNLTLKDGDRGHTTLYYEFDGADFRTTPLIPAQDRTGDVNAIGGTRAIYTCQGRGRIFFGFRFENASTIGSDYDRNTAMVTARIERPIGKQWIVDSEVRQFWDDYKHGNSLDFNGRPRNDQRTEVRAGIQRYFNGHISLRLDYAFYYSNSNVVNLFDVAFFEYNRHVLASQLIYDF